MNVLFLAKFPFLNAGGVGRVTETLAPEFMRRGYKCHFLAARCGTAYEEDGITQFFVPSSSTASKLNCAFLCQLVNDEKIDVIINQSGAEMDVFNLAISARKHCIVFTVHHNCVACLQSAHRSIVDHVFDRYHLPRWVRRDWVYRALKARSRKRTAKAFEWVAAESDKLILLSNAFIPELEVFSQDIDIANVAAIPNPSPFGPQPSAIEEKENELLFVGRLANQQKRVDRLLHIWAEVAPSFPDWHLKIVGDGPDRSWLEAMSSDMGLERISFHGACDPVPFYRKARMLILTSDFEGFPMVLPEAQAHGCVPVSTDSFSSVSDIIEDGKNGFIIPGGMITKFSAVLSELMTQEDQLEQVAHQAMQDSERYSVESIADKWVEMFLAVQAVRQRKEYERPISKNISSIR